MGRPTVGARYAANIYASGAFGAARRHSMVAVGQNAWIGYSLTQPVPKNDEGTCGSTPSLISVNRRSGARLLLSGPGNNLHSLFLSHFQCLMCSSPPVCRFLPVVCPIGSTHWQTWSGLFLLRTSPVGTSRSSVSMGFVPTTFVQWPVSLMTGSTHCSLAT